MSVSVKDGCFCLVHVCYVVLCCNRKSKFYRLSVLMFSLGEGRMKLGCVPCDQCEESFQMISIVLDFGPKSA